MQDQDKTKGQLIDELRRLRLLVAELPQGSPDSMDTGALTLETNERLGLAPKEEDLVIGDLRSSARLLRGILSASPVGIGMAQDRVMKWVNDAWVRLFGFENEEECLGQSARMIYLSQEDYERVGKELHSDLETGKVAELDTKFRRKDGSVFDAHIRMATFDVLGLEKVTISAIADISDRKAAEEALRNSEARFNTAFHSTPDAITITRMADGKFVEVNEAFTAMSGYSADDALTSSSLGLNLWANPQDREKVLADLRDKKRTRDKEVSFRTKSDKIIDCLYSGEIMLLGDEELVLSVVRDITERKQVEKHREALQAQLIQSQKMEAIGTLAAGIAHDFNNMLQVILGYSDMLLSEKNEGDPGYEELGKILKTAFDARDLVQKIRIFSRKADMKLIPVDLNNRVIEVTKLLSHTLPKTVDIEVRLAKDPAMIRADSALMDQMLMNLAINAGEAMLHGGTLTVETQNLVLDEDFCRSHAGAKPGPHVVLTVTDTGRGISKEIIERIFDPFFSTKQRDYRRGTGLGLSVVQGIVEQHGGFITVESEVGKGATCRAFFPALEHEPIAEVAEKKEELSIGGTETILLVEDEEAVRELGITMLRRFGYTVLAASDGMEALDVYRKEMGNISLIILDVVMPRMEGKECLEELLKINPAVKVIVSTGLDPFGLVRDLVRLGARDFVNKPFGMRRMLEVVREVLDSD